MTDLVERLRRIKTDPNWTEGEAAAFQLGYEAAALDAQPVGLDVDRLALAVARAVVEADHRFPSGYSMTGDLVPLIAAEYAALASEPKP